MQNLKETLQTLSEQKRFINELLEKDSLELNSQIYMTIASNRKQLLQEILLDDQVPKLLSLSPKALETQISKESDFEAARHLMNATMFLNLTQNILECAEGICMNSNNADKMAFYVRKFYAELSL